MTTIPRISIHDYDYDLPAARIAQHPVIPKHDAQLLIYNEGIIEHDRFWNLNKYLQSGELVLVNNTKVIPARLWVEKSEGVWIQLFLLKPLAHDWSVWHVMVGNRRKFKESDRLSINRDGEVLNIQWEDREANTIQFSSKERSIAEWIELLGEIPLPPYLNREVEERDKLDYQAVFARNKGAVAAPTASLHFTTELIARLNDAGIEWAEATLHVGAGTFKPVTVDFVDEHEMHAEQFEINLILLDVLLNRSGGVVALGTTACRVLESLPILGAKIILGEADSLFVSAEDGYRADILAIPTREALHALREYIMSEGGVIRGETQIFMIPGFDFRLTSAMITNFHQPKSTLMLLVSAFVGGDWKEIYEAALAKDYRFLSYGDGSLLRGKKKITW
jgi:S-adenosylmethionine:tRNA ribosyltransferase-isomerase